MKIAYLPIFIRQFKKLSKPLQEEAKEKIALFQQNPNHAFLKTHKLKGIFKEKYSFSVNYEYRIVFEYLSKNEAVLMAIGDHSIYS